MSTARPVLVIPGRPRPHEIAILLWSVWVGATYLAGAPRPASSLLLPDWVFWTLTTLLSASGLVALLGCVWRGDVRVGLELERGALTAHAGALVLQASTLFGVAGWRALSAGGVIAVLAGADLWRCWQIREQLRETRNVAP